MPEFHAEVSRIKDLTHDVRELELSLVAPDSIEFKAGQWFLNRCLASETETACAAAIFDCFSAKSVATNLPSL